MLKGTPSKNASYLKMYIKKKCKYFHLKVLFGSVKIYATGVFISVPQFAALFVCSLPVKSRKGCNMH